MSLPRPLQLFAVCVPGSPPPPKAEKKRQRAADADHRRIVEAAEGRADLVGAPSRACRSSPRRARAGRFQASARSAPAAEAHLGGGGERQHRPQARGGEQVRLNDEGRARLAVVLPCKAIVTRSPCLIPSRPWRQAPLPGSGPARGRLDRPAPSRPLGARTRRRSRGDGCRARLGKEGHGSSSGQLERAERI